MLKNDFLQHNYKFSSEKVVVKALKIVKENRMPIRSSSMMKEDDLCVEMLADKK